MFVVSAVAKQNWPRLKLRSSPSNRAGQRRAAVVVVYGPGGSGKSALAVHLAHKVAAEFPDGQLYVDLLGSTPGLRPLGPIDVPRSLLRGLGLRESEIPHDAADAAAHFRTVTADRRLLIVLDNMADAGWLTALLPANHASAVLVTSRRPFGGLDVDRRLRLDGLPAHVGSTLLAQLAEEVAIDTVIADRIVQLCARLPLAIHTAAGRLTTRPDLSPAEFAKRLADRRMRLDELELDGLGVRSSVGIGYEALASGENHVGRLAARAFKAVGLLNVPDVDPAVVPAMLQELNVAVVCAALDHLVNAGLIEPLPGGRHRFHDLVRLVAAERATEDNSSRTETLPRGLAYYARGADQCRPRPPAGSHVRCR
jgi:hypothetical protein